MQPTTVELLKVYPVEGRYIVHAPAGRGEELRIHLASHGIATASSQPATGSFDRLEVAGDIDAEAVQTILDHWEQ
jgi:hypothetical protein